MKLAAIDLGSNTVKLTVAEASPGGALEPLEERADITRIGQGLDEAGRILDEAVERTMVVLHQYVGLCEAAGVERMACVATAGLRGADNADAFIARVRRELGLEVEVIEGLREAELAFRAPAAELGGALVVLDVGGRSTELITGRDGQLMDRVSLEMGGVRLTERFLPDDPPTPGQLATLRDHVRGVLADAPAAPDGAQLVGVSGTIISLMGVHLGLDDLAETVSRGEGGRLPRAAIRATFDDLARRPAADRIRGTVIPVGRADVIVAGTAVVLEVMDRYGVDELRVTNRGVRYGVLAELARA